MSSGRMRSGWWTTNPRVSASCLTALIEARRPRPAGRSGWVRTSAMSWPASASRPSAIAANSGVPAKTRRRKARSGGLAQLLGELCANPLLLQLRQVLDEDLAFEVVHLVLDADRQKALRLQGERVAVLIEGAHFDPLGALDQLVDARHGQTAFLDVGHTGGFEDLGIDQHDQGIAALRDINHDDLLVHVDLGCGKPNTG